MSRIPSLGPRGEGWVALQVAALGLVVVAGRAGAPVVIGNDGLQASVSTIGDLLVVAGVLLLVVAVAVLRGGGAFTVFPRPIASGQLIEAGPYRFVRHPVYSGLLLAAFGAALVRPSLLALLAAILLALVLDLKRRREEAWLLSRYEGYAAYRTRTRALVPFIY